MVFFRSNSEIKTKLRQIKLQRFFLWILLSVFINTFSVHFSFRSIGCVRPSVCARAAKPNGFFQYDRSWNNLSKPWYTIASNYLGQNGRKRCSRCSWIKTGRLTHFSGNQKINHNLTLWSISSTKLQRFNSNLSLYAPNIVNSSPHQKWWSKVSNFDFEILFPDAPFSRV